MKKQLSLLVVAALPLAGFSQRVVFDYDAAGNRISRALSNGASNAPSIGNTDIEPLTEQWQTLYVGPNPCSDILYVRFSQWTDNDRCQLQLTNMSGQVFIEQLATSFQTSLSLSALQSGYYILSVELNGERKEYKIVKM